MVDKLRSIDEIPEAYVSVFTGYPKFNLVQSEVLDEVLHTDNSLVVSAPTGSGKTAIFEMAIVRILNENKSPTLSAIRMVYVSPMRALCTERTLDWGNKFKKYGVKTICITGDSENFNLQHIFSYNLIICTPEKWDILTRRWRRYEQLMRTIKLFMIDEVQLLNADSRGPTLEVIVCRVKTMENVLLQNYEKIRFLALSASIANVEDIADWLGTNGDKRFFKFSEETRPVKLNKIVIGYSNNHKNFFTFDIALTYRLPNLIKMYSHGKPTLIFCSTRKSVEMTSSHLVENLGINLSDMQKRMLQELADSLSDDKLKKSVVHGVAIHHAGLLMENRNIIEQGFREFKIPVLVTTSTLAMGVNLPAHLVIIKSTKTYEKDHGYKDYDEIAIFQMIGRAGRIQFDTSGTAVILTSHADKSKYEHMLNCTQPIESNLHKHLTEHINAEIVLRTITDLDGALRWVFSTFLYFRAQKCPIKYGLKAGLNADQIDRKLLELCQVELGKLVKAGMCTMNENTDVSATEIGEIMANFYVSFDTMRLFTEVSGYESMNQLLTVISKCKEFVEVRLRVSDKRCLNLLNYNRATQESIRFKLKGKISTVDMKVNCLIQSVLANREISDHSLLNDVTNIMRNCERISGCFIEYLQTRSDCYNALLNATILAKCFQCRLWENSPFVAKQLKGIGQVLSNLLVNAGKDSFQKIAMTNPRQIEMILNKKAPFGSQIVEAAKNLPFYDLKMDIYDSKMRLTIRLLNGSDLDKKSTINLESKMTLLVGNSENKVLLYEQYTHAYMMENPTVITGNMTIETNRVEFIHADFISENWVGIDCKAEYDFPKPSNNDRRTIQTSLDIYASKNRSVVNSDKTRIPPVVAKAIAKIKPSQTKLKPSIRESSTAKPTAEKKFLEANSVPRTPATKIVKITPDTNAIFNQNNEVKDGPARSSTAEINIYTLDESVLDHNTDVAKKSDDISAENVGDFYSKNNIIESEDELNKVNRGQNRNDSPIIEYKTVEQKENLTSGKNRTLFHRMFNKYSQMSVKLGKPVDVGTKRVDQHSHSGDSQKQTENKDDAKRKTDILSEVDYNKYTLNDSEEHNLDEEQHKQQTELLNMCDSEQNRTPTESIMPAPSINCSIRSKYPNIPKINKSNKDPQTVKKQLIFDDLIKPVGGKSSCNTPLVDELLNSWKEVSTEMINPEKINPEVSSESLFSNSREHMIFDANFKSDQIATMKNQDIDENNSSNPDSLAKSKSQMKQNKRNELKKTIMEPISDSPPDDLDKFKELVDDDWVSLLQSSDKNDVSDSINNNDENPTYDRNQLNNIQQEVAVLDTTVLTPTYMIKELIQPSQFSKPQSTFGNELSQIKTLRWRSPLIESPVNKFSPKFNFSPRLSTVNQFGSGINMSRDSTEEHNTTTSSSMNRTDHSGRQIKITETSKPKTIPRFPISDKECLGGDTDCTPRKRFKDNNDGYSKPYISNPLNTSHYEELTNEDLCARLRSSQSIPFSQTTTVDKNPKPEQFSRQDLSSQKHLADDFIREFNDNPDLPSQYSQQVSIKNCENVNYPRSAFEVQYYNPNNAGVFHQPQPRYPDGSYIRHPFRSEFDPRFPPHYSTSYSLLDRPDYSNPRSMNPYYRNDFGTVSPERVPLRQFNQHLPVKENLHLHGNPYFDSHNQVNNSTEHHFRQNDNVMPRYVDLPFTITSQHQGNDSTEYESRGIDNIERLNNSCFDFKHGTLTPRQNHQIDNPGELRSNQREIMRSQDDAYFDRQMSLNNNPEHLESRQRQHQYGGNRYFKSELDDGRIRENMNPMSTQELYNLERGYFSQVNQPIPDSKVLPVPDRSPFDYREAPKVLPVPDRFDYRETQSQRFDPFKRSMMYGNIFSSAKDTNNIQRNQHGSISQFNKTDIRKIFGKADKRTSIGQKNFLRHASFDRRTHQEEVVPANARSTAPTCVSSNNGGDSGPSRIIPMMPFIPQNRIYAGSNQNNRQMSFTPRCNMENNRFPDIPRERENDKRFVMDKFLHSFNNE